LAGTRPGPDRADPEATQGLDSWLLGLLLQFLGAELDCGPGQPPQIQIPTPAELFVPPFGLRKKFPASAVGVSARCKVVN